MQNMRMTDALHWLAANKEWVFSGVGVAIVLSLVGLFRSRRAGSQAPTAVSESPIPPAAPVQQSNNQVVNVTVQVPSPPAPPAASGPEPEASTASSRAMASSGPPAGSITGEPQAILLFLRDASGGPPVTAGILTGVLSIPHARVELHLDSLHDLGLIGFTARLYKSPVWYLNSSGRQYLAASGLL